MKVLKMNGGWRSAFVGWIASSIIFPFLPEITRSAIYGTPMGIFGFPPMEYIATIGLWAVLFLIVWMPAGFAASRICREKGLRAAHRFVAAVFLILFFVMEILFNYFWNS